MNDTAPYTRSAAPDSSAQSTNAAPVTPEWSVADSSALYGFDRWSAGYFHVSEAGTVQVAPQAPDGPRVDLAELAGDLAERGIRLPALVRFTDILRSRTDLLLGAFEKAVTKHAYPGSYRGVIPIKVNQQWHVARAVVEHGRQRGLGLEVGTKPELYIAIGLATEPEDLIICNGFKDQEYVELALGAQKLGRRPILVIDRVGKLGHLIEISRRLGVRPHLGVRVKPATRGAGCWSDSGGDRSKFGLDTTELLETIEVLRAADMLDCVELLHFHVGSQISSVAAVQKAAREVARIFVELCGLGLDLKYLDCGGGLAVEYGGTVDHGTRDVDYTVEDYASALVTQIGETCLTAGVAAPTILSESGRALLAHHSVLLFNVLEVHQAEPDHVITPPGVDDIDLSHMLWALAHDSGHPQAALERSAALRGEAMDRFSRAEITLVQRARFESIANTCERRIRARADAVIPTDIYYGNFSLFQSLPDYWGIDQLFPVVPIHALDQQPTRRGVIVDLSCDSHGTVKTFIGDGSGEHGVLLHEPPEDGYVLGVFLVGAYQKSLSSLHNLFGATNAVHVALTADGYELHEVAEGESMNDVLEYVRYPRDQVLRDLTRDARAGVAAGRLQPSEAKALLNAHRAGLDSYTYLVED